VEALPGSSEMFNVTFQPQDGSTPRSVVGEYYGATWENLKKPCLYMGNGQGGSAGLMSEMDNSVIRGKYTDYIMDSLFDTNFVYEEWKSDCTASAN